MAYAKIIDIDDPGYFRLKSIDQSQLKQFLKNPADWAYHRLNDDHKPTDAMKFGTAFHAYLLGTSDVVSLPEGESFRSKDNQKWRDEQLEAGNIIVSYNDMQLLKRMKEGIEQTSLMPEYPDYMEIIEQGTKEQCIEWKDRQTGLMLKAKPDSCRHRLPGRFENRSEGRCGIIRQGSHQLRLSHSDRFLPCRGSRMQAGRLRPWVQGSQHHAILGVREIRCLRLAAFQHQR